MTGSFNRDQRNTPDSRGLLPGGGKMGELIRAFDWSRTSLGPVSQWSIRLRVSVENILRSPAPLVILYGREGITLYNDAYINFAKTKHPDLLGRRCEVAWPEAAPFIRNVIDKCLQGESLSYKSLPYKVNRGESWEDIWLDLDCSPIPDDEGHPIAVLIVNVENTENIRTRQTLKENAEKFRRMIEASNDGIWEYNAETRKTFWNDRMYEITGYSRESVSDYGYDFISSIIHPDDRDRVQAAFTRTLTEGVKYNIEYRLKHKNGHYLYFHGRANPILDNKGKVIRIVGIGMDISERMNAENALKESEQRYRTMAEASDILIAHTDESGKAIYFNRGWVELTGRSMEGLLNSGWTEFLHPEDHENFLSAYWSNYEKKGVLKQELRLRSHEGDYRWFFAVITPRYAPNGSFAGFVSSCVDITERKQSEEALKESEDRFKTFANNIQNLAWMANPDGWIFWYNQRWYDYTGTTLEQMQGWGWEKVHHPDYVDSVVQFAEGAWKQGETWELIFPLRAADGTYRWFLTRAYAVKDAKGQVLRWIGTNTDIDNQKKAEEELQLRNEQLMRINNDLDNFIYTASHDLKAPILNLEGLLNAYKLENDFSEEQQAVIDMMYRSIDRFKNTIKDLTEISKLQRLNQQDQQQLDFIEILSEVKLDIRELIERYKPEIAVHFAVPSILYSKKNLRSIIYNLLSNALKYSAPQRQLKVEISTARRDGFIMLKISDNGLGINRESHTKIFGMFKRAHDHVEGSGVGLYMIKRMIENAGGKIEVESEEGKGTAFTVYFSSGA